MGVWKYSNRKMIRICIVDRDHRVREERPWPRPFWADPRIRGWLDPQVVYPTRPEGSHPAEGLRPTRAASRPGAWPWPAGCRTPLGPRTPIPIPTPVPLPPLDRISHRFRTGTLSCAGRSSARRPVCAGASSSATMPWAPHGGGGAHGTVGGCEGGILPIVCLLPRM